MKYGYLSLLLLLLLVGCSGNETEKDDSENETADTTSSETIKVWEDLGFESLIPEGYSVMDSLRGHLNQDDIIDMVVVLKSDNEVEGEYSEMERPLLILVGDMDESWLLAARNDHVVKCQGCGGVFGDPYDGISINELSFGVSHYGGSRERWATFTEFSWDQEAGTWFLSKEELTTFDALEPEGAEITELLQEENYFIISFTEYEEKF